MSGGKEPRRPPLRAARRGVAVFGLCASAFFGFGLSGVSAQTVPCILVVCGTPTPLPLPTLPLPTLPLPTPTLPIPLPTVTLPPVPLPTLPPAPVPTLTPVPLPTLPPVPLPTLTPVPTALPTLPLPTLPLPTASLPLPTSTVSNPLPTLPGGLPTLPGGGTGQGTPTPPANPFDGGLGTGATPCALPIPALCGLTNPPSTNPSPGCVLSDPTCIIPGSGGGPSGDPSGGGGGNHSSSGSNGGGGGGTDQALPGTSFSTNGGSLSGGGAGDPAAATQRLGLLVASVPAVAQLSPVSGLQFGHALILWPLFGLLDLLGLGAVYLVVRRFRVTPSD